MKMYSMAEAQNPGRWPGRGGGWEQHFDNQNVTTTRIKNGIQMTTASSLENQSRLNWG